MTKKMRTGKRTWEVEFNFINENTPFNIQTGFATEAEAQAWAEKNTIDGKVSWTEQIFFD